MSTFHEPPQASPHTPRLPRSADAQHYAQWAVRRIGTALLIGILGPFIVGITAMVLLGGTEVAEFVAVIASGVTVVGAILSLCLARAPG